MASTAGPPFEACRWGRSTCTPGRTLLEELTDEGTCRRPPSPDSGSSAGGGKNTRGKDQNQLRRPGLRTLGSAAVCVAARSAILVRPAHLPALDPSPVTAPRRADGPCQLVRGNSAQAMTNASH